MRERSFSAGSGVVAIYLSRADRTASRSSHAPRYLRRTLLPRTLAGSDALALEGDDFAVGGRRLVRTYRFGHGAVRTSLLPFSAVCRGRLASRASVPLLTSEAIRDLNASMQSRLRVAEPLPLAHRGRAFLKQLSFLPLRRPQGEARRPLARRSHQTGESCRGSQKTYRVHHAIIARLAV
jgi:hypothetical protein